MRKALLLLITLSLSTLAYADVDNPVSVTEEDGSPDTYPWRVKFPNGTVTDNADGTTSISITADAVVGPTPATATDSAIVAWDGTTGRLLKDTNLITGSSFISYGTAGVRLTGDGDGALALDGLGNGSDENLTINLDDTSNEATLSSTTGVTLVNLSGMNLATGGSGIPNITLGSGSTANTTITSDVSGVDTSINFSSGKANFSGDITVSGDDIFMLTNTKGGLLAANGTSFIPFPVGVTDGMVLSVDSTAATGLKWGFAGGGGGAGDMVLASTQTNTGVKTFNSGTLKFPDIANIIDGNGNEILSFDAVTSAVNYFVIADSATATNPVLSADGTDANVGIGLNTKGTGAVVINTGPTATQSTINSGLKVNNGAGGATADHFIVVSRDSTNLISADTQAGVVYTSGRVQGTNTFNIGWTPVNSANQACNTTCTSACVFGIDTSAIGNILACTDATADSCLCAGPS